MDLNKSFKMEKYEKVNRNKKGINIGRRPIIAIDFDDTIAKGGFPDISKATLIDGAKEYIKLLKQHLNCDIIIWTCRSDNEKINDAKKFLNDNDIPYDYFNENSKELEFDSSPKLYYDHLIDDKCFLEEIDWCKAYKQALCKVQGDRCDELTPEMIKWHYERTERHIRLVQEFFLAFYKGKDDIIRSSNIRNHDVSKYEPILFVPYVKMNWVRAGSRNNGYELTTAETISTYEATVDHIIYATHHPEYSWAIEQRANGVSEEVIRNKAYKSDECLNISGMRYTDISEMCADWCAMAVEFNNTPMEWAKEQIGKRWDFGEYTNQLIFDTLDKMWGLYGK